MTVAIPASVLPGRRRLVAACVFVAVVVLVGWNLMVDVSQPARFREVRFPGATVGLTPTTDDGGG
jgi:hypothetical protein